MTDEIDTDDGRELPFPPDAIPEHEVQRTAWVGGLLLASGIGFCVCGLFMLEVGGPIPLVGMALSAAGLLVGMLAFTHHTIDSLFERELGRARLGKLHVLNKDFPAYRFADLILAVSALAERSGRALRVESQHDWALAPILSGGSAMGSDRRLKKPPRVAVSIDYHEERYVPSDQFWILRPPKGDEEPSPFGLAILRVRQMQYTGEVVLELAADGPRSAEAAIEELLELANQRSVYRNKLLSVRFDGGTVDEWGDIQAGREVLGFLKERPVGRDDVILPDRTWRLLDRVVFDAFAKRERLVELGVPAKRGLLFHGPPGTGKTYTCRYIYSNLEQVTTLVASGNALAHVKSVCNLARMLQPSLVVLEDVDLAFSSREINLYSSALGDLMDELDGFARDDAVTFLLTTNAIERLEKAISDRPGRISQCIFFGPPTDDLRRRYLECYLRSYDTSQLPLEGVVDRTGGASQAFLRELINRAIQICLDDPERGPVVRLADTDFYEALDEMTDSDAAAAGAIVGFTPPRRDMITPQR